VPDGLDLTALDEAVEVARSAYGLDHGDLDTEGLLDHLWKEGHYQHVYAFRRDFAYG
jgi:hypothetical protein